MTTAVAKPIRRADLKPGENLCDYCTARCCQYFALPIDEPTEREDFENLRWYMLHGRVSIFVDDDVWYLMVHNVCDHLQDDNRCGIYETRPQICRDYSTKNCEFDDDTVYDRYFESPEQIAEYMEATFPAVKRRKPNRTEQIALPVVTAPGS